MLSYTPRPHMIALTMEENLSSRMTMSDAFWATCSRPGHDGTGRDGTACSFAARLLHPIIPHAPIPYDKIFRLVAPLRPNQQKFVSSSTSISEQHNFVFKKEKKN